VFRIIFGCLTGLMISLWVSSISYAETIVLDNGDTVTGQIIERTELRIMVDVNGTLKTFFLGEVASIDGQAISMPQDEKVAADIAKVEQNPKPVPYFGAEQDSLEKTMAAHNQNSPAAQPPAAVTSTATPPVADQTTTSTASLTAGPNKAVVATPDGGIIVVDSGKITKYDKDFKVVKEVDLPSDNTTPTAAPVPATADASATAPVVVAPASPAPDAPSAAPASAAPAPAASDSTADAQPPTLKDFFDKTMKSIFQRTKKKEIPQSAKIPAALPPAKS